MMMMMMMMIIMMNVKIIIRMLNTAYVHEAFKRLEPELSCLLALKPRVHIAQI